MPDDYLTATHDARTGCCVERRKPCTYHEGWSDGYEVAEAERDAALAEVTRLREALEAVRAELKDWRWDCVNEALTILDTALAEGSDVLPTQRDH